MVSEIIIIILLVGILVLLLRHWPETEMVVRQQLNVRKPLEEHEKRPDRAQPTIWKRIVTAVTTGYETAKGWFARTPKTPKEDPQRVLAPVTHSEPRVDAAPKPAEPGEVSVEMLMSQAEAAQRSGNYEEAEDCLVKAAAADPKNPKIYSRLGIVYLERGENWPEAEEAFRQALRYDAGNGYVHNNLGLVLYNQDKFAAAAREFEAALSVDDAIASRHVNLGLAFMSLRQFSKAETTFKRAIKLEPNNREYQDLLTEAAAKRQAHKV